MEITNLIKELRNNNKSSEEEGNCLKYLLESEKYLEEYIHKTSGECKEILDIFSKSAETLFESTKRHQIDDTNVSMALECIVQIIELCQSEYGSLTLNDLNKQVSSTLCSTILKKYFTNVLKKSLFLLKLNTKSTVDYQIQCVKFLRLSIKENKSHMRQIAIEFNYFQDKKTWLDKYIHQNNSYNLRVESVKFLLSFLNYSISKEIEIQVITRKIFIQQHTSNVIQSLFSTLLSNQRELIETVLDGFLTNVIKCPNYTKSDKVRLFNERNLLSLMKLYNWKNEEIDPDSPAAAEDCFYEMLTAFLKVLFSTTQFGISFYDRTLGIQLLTTTAVANVNISAKNLNHLIFNSIVSVQTISKKCQLDAFNKMLLNVFKVCPDLMQRFFKYKNKQLQQQSLSEDSNEKSGLLTLNWLVDFSIELFDQQKVLISKNKFLNKNLTESTYTNVDYICELIIQTSIPISIPLIRMMSSKTTNSINQRFKCINLLIKCLLCLNEWKKCLNSSASGDHLKFLNKNSSTILFNLNQQLFMNKYLPTLDLLNINDIIPADSLLGSDQIVQLIDLYSLYFDLILNANNDDFTIQNMLQIEYINQKFFVNLTNLMLDKCDLQPTTAESFMKFLLHFLKLKQLYDTNENFEAIISELVYKLVKLFIKYGYEGKEGLLNCYIKFIEISFMKLIQLNERNEFNESLFQLWFVLFYKFVHSDETDAAAANENFFIDYADCCLKSFFNFKINDLFLVESGGVNFEIKKIFLNQTGDNSVEKGGGGGDLSTLLLFECSIQTYFQFKSRFIDNNSILLRIEEFLKSFLLKALLIQTNANEFENIKIYMQQKGFQSIVDQIESGDGGEEEVMAEGNNEEFNELKIKNLLSLIHRSFEFDDKRHLVLLDRLLGLCKCERTCGIVLNDSIIKNNAFKDSSMINFLIKFAELENAPGRVFFDSDGYLERVLAEIQTNTQQFDLILKFVSKLKNLNKTFLINLSSFKNVHSNESYCLILVNNRETIINNENLRLFELCFKNLLKFLSKSTDESLISLKTLDQFLCDCYNFKPNFCSYLSRNILKKAKKIDCLKRYAANFVEILSIDGEKGKIDEMMVVEEESDGKYGGTLSRKDQVTIQNRFKLEKNMNFLKFMNSGEKQSHLNIEVKLNDFINEKINLEIIEKSILNFQVSRKISDILDGEQIKFDDSQVYDPVYLLANFYALLHYGNIVDVSQFIQSKCLSYLFISLSSKCDKLRALAYGALYRFNLHLENTKLYCKNVLSYLIKLLRNSIEKENQKIPFVVSLFLAQLVPIIMEPGSPLFKQIVSFLLIKPAIDLTNVPEFYTFFNSSSLDHKFESKWILGILRHGLKTGLDYRLYEKRFIFRQVLASYDSGLSSYESKLDILELIKSSCHLKSVLIDLIKKHSLIIWLSNAITRCQIHGANTRHQGDQNNKNIEIFYKLCEIIILIWTTITSSSTTPPPALFIKEFFPLVNISLDYFSKLTTTTHNYLYEAFFKLFDEILCQTRLINENQANCLSTHCLTEVDLKRLFSLRLKKSLENINQVHSSYLYVVVGLLQDERYLKEMLSRDFLKENIKFILSFVSNTDKIRVLSTNNEEKFKQLFNAIQNLLKYFNSEEQEVFDSNYDTFYEISINIAEILTNLNHFKNLNFVDFSQFCEVFKEFLLKIKNNSQEEEVVFHLYDDQEKLFLSENCYSMLIA